MAKLTQQATRIKHLTEKYKKWQNEAVKRGLEIERLSLVIKNHSDTLPSGFVEEIEKVLADYIERNDEVVMNKGAKCKE